jgi:Lon protease-like protein
MELQQLPLFPLNTVLFPGMPLPLHIFEDRYRLMIGECSEYGQPFGVVLIKSGQEVGAPAQPRDVGTTAEIAALTRLDDGRMNLLALGRERFRIVELIQERPYLVAQVATVIDEPDEVGSRELVTALAAGLTGYLDALFALRDQQRESFELPAEPEALSYVIASVLQVGLEEKQSLLETASTPERLRQELAWLQRENEAMSALLRVKERIGTVTRFDPSGLRDLISPN